MVERERLMKGGRGEGRGEEGMGNSLWTILETRQVAGGRVGRMAYMIQSRQDAFEDSRPLSSSPLSA